MHPKNVNFQCALPQVTHPTPQTLSQRGTDDSDLSPQLKGTSQLCHDHNHSRGGFPCRTRMGVSRPTLSISSRVWKIAWAVATPPSSKGCLAGCPVGWGLEGSLESLQPCEDLRPRPHAYQLTMVLPEGSNLSPLFPQGICEEIL